MCIPLSLFRLARITLFPLFSKILERLSTRKIFLRWPKCSGLFVFGDGNSTIILFFSLPEPNFSFSFKILVNVRSTSKDLLIKKFRYGPTASTLLKDLFNLILFFNSSAILCGSCLYFFAKKKQGREKSP